jgi:hypothetical protein
MKKKHKSNKPVRIFPRSLGWTTANMPQAKALFRCPACGDRVYRLVYQEIPSRTALGCACGVLKCGQWDDGSDLKEPRNSKEWFTMQEKNGPIPSPEKRACPLGRGEVPFPP